MNNTIEIIQNWDETKDGHIREEERGELHLLKQIEFKRDIYVFFYFINFNLKQSVHPPAQLFKIIIFMIFFFLLLLQSQSAGRKKK